jgi:uncharacterized protein (TIGR02246 family)
MTPNERNRSWTLWTAGAFAAALLSMQAGRWATSALRKWAFSALSAMMMATMVSASPAADEQTPARAGLNADIVKVAETYRRAVIAGDARAAAATYRDDAMELGPCGPPLKGRAAIEEHYRRLFQNVKFSSFTFSHLEATADGNLGYAAGTYEETAGPDGTSSMALTGKYLVLLKRGPDGWKSAYVIFNFDGPPPPCGQ